MEVLNNELLQLRDKQKEGTISSPNPSLRRTNKRLTTKFNVHSNEFSISRIRRISSITQNITSLFSQNQDKLCLYLKTESLNSDALPSQNLQNPEIYSTLEDGVYILIQGSIQIINFPEERPPPKAEIKELITSYFRKLRASRQSRSKLKDCGNQMIKKNSSRDKNQWYQNCTTLDQPFTIFECINQNCCSFSNQTILYMLDEDQIRNFKYVENKQKLRELIQQNKPFFKTNTSLVHSFVYKKMSFRTQFRINNVAIIKKGSLRVFTEQYKKEKNADTKSQNLRQQICELCKPSLLVKGFTYQVSSCQSEIIFIENNDTFEFRKNPQWVTRFHELMAEKMGRKRYDQNQINKKPSLTLFKKPMSKIASKESLFHHFMTLNQNNQKTSSFESFHIHKEPHSENSKSAAHRKSFSQLQITSNTSQNKKVRLLPHEKQKKNEMLRIISPYVLISQKIGLKEITKTRSILNQRSQNVSPLQSNSPLNLNKISRNHLKKCQTQYSEPKCLDRCNMQNVPNDRRCILRFEKFLKGKNQGHYHEKIKEKQKKNNDNLFKVHRKSTSELAPIASSNFYLESSNLNLGLNKSKIINLEASFQTNKNEQSFQQGIKKKSLNFRRKNYPEEMI